MSPARPTISALLSDITHSPEALTRLDRALLALRHVLVRPVTSELQIPSLGRSVEFAKVAACEGVAGVSADGATVTVKSLAEALQLDHSTMSRVVADCEADGLLVRGSDPADRRRTTISLTADGDSLVADSLALRVWFMGEVLADWPEADLETLTYMLERAVSTFDARFRLVHRAAEERLGYPLPLE